MPYTQYVLCKLEPFSGCTAMRSDGTAQDVVVGKSVQPQLAKAAKDPQQALDAMKGKPFLLETKFDGEMCFSYAPHVSVTKHWCRN